MSVNEPTPSEIIGLFDRYSELLQMIRDGQIVNRRSLTVKIPLTDVSNIKRPKSEKVNWGRDGF